MSTILDALRKVEEEKRTQETDVRTRLLSRSPRFDFRTPRRSHLPWVVGGGLVFVGIVCGAGLMLWNSPDSTSVVDVTSSPLSAPQVVASQPQPATPPGPQPQRQSQPESQSPTTHIQSQGGPRSQEETARPQSPTAQITPQAAAVSLPKESAPVVPSSATAGKAPIIAETTPQYDPWAGGNLQKAAGKTPGKPSAAAVPRASEEMVQRSPFVNSSPYDQTVAPPPLPPPSERRVAVAAPKPVRPRPQAAEKSGHTTPNPPATTNDPPPSAPPPTSEREQTPNSPPGASLSFLQWSADPEKRVASIKVGTGPATIAHEGDSIEGLTIVKIHPDAVEVRSGESHYLLKAR